MIENIFNPEVLKALAVLEKIFLRFKIDFYLVGALARDVHFSLTPALKATRKTKDVDIAIMIINEDQFYSIKEAILETGDFTAHETEAIKLYYKHAIEIDLLPFGEIENEDRETRIHKPKLFTMDMPGFREVLPDAEELTIAEGVSLKVCSIEGLVLLKLIANDDNPSRTKDITDIAHLINIYFELNDDDIYTDHLDLMEKYDVTASNYLQLIGARVIGRKISSTLGNSEQLQKRVINITRKRLLETWQAMADGMEEP